MFMHISSKEIHLDDRTSSPLIYEDLGLQIVQFENSAALLIFMRTRMEMVRRNVLLLRKPQ